MKLLIVLLFLVTISCNNYIDSNKIEEREHGLRYIKGTNELVNGKAVRKSNGKIIELNSYENGKMVGEWYQVDSDGKIGSHGFGIEVKKYEKILNGFNLSNSILSIVITGNVTFSYATLYMDNSALFNDKVRLLSLSREILKDYSARYKIDGLLIFDHMHEFSITKEATLAVNCTFDTIPNTKPLRVNIR